MRGPSLLPLAALMLITTPGAARHADSDPLDGRVAGQPQSCAPGTITSNVVIAGPDRIMTSATARRIWVAPVTGCPALRRDDILIVEHLSGSSGTCRNDRLRALRPGGIIPGPYCRVGAFTPYDKPK